MFSSGLRSAIAHVRLFRPLKLYKTLALTFLILACLASPTLAQSPALKLEETIPLTSESPDPALQKALDQVALSRIELGELVGLVILVYKDGAPIYQGAAGWADREAQKPMFLEALFRLSSVSKAFTTMAAGALISRGQLELEAPLGQYLADFSPKNPDLKDPRAAQIAIKHLLTHQAGFNYTFSEKLGGPYHRLKIADGCASSKGVTLEENLKRLAQAPLLSQPGTKYVYSVASDVLGAVIAKAYGQSLPQAMEDLVLKPLGVKDTGFVAQDQEKLTTPYRDAKPYPKRMAEPEFFKSRGDRTLTLSPTRAANPEEFPSGGCGLVSSAPSVMKLLEAIGNEGGGIVDPKVMAIFYQDLIAPAQSSTGQGFGASWAVVTNPTAAKLAVSPGTLQWGGVYGHNWYVDRARGLSVAILTNTALKGLSGTTKNLVLEAIAKVYPVEGNRKNKK
ncbi:MAG: beta-lactamase family protein [Deltaproteobacteria bacterium]|jgi:CubicO group peptidase (beta-lactamase class C family)|nr:beta-lactamase family protein [Deltaproteobacteria bacterium]